MRAFFPRPQPVGEMDLHFLSDRRGYFHDLDQSDDPQARGRNFDLLMAEVLRGHGCTAEVTNKADGEQIDVFASMPFRILVECKWEAARTGPAVIMVLQSKVRERHAAVAGLFVSMSGFTEKALEKERDTRDRVLVCAKRADVESWLDGTVWFQKRWDNRLDLLVTRYDRDAKKS